MTHQQAVSAMVKSGVKPLTLRYRPISDCSSLHPMAFRTTTVIHSLELGTLTEREYSYATDCANTTGIRLAEWNIREALRAICQFEEEKKEIAFVSVRCPASLADLDNLYERVKTMLGEQPEADPEKLCLEFPQSLLYLTGENVRKSILDMKLLHVKTMLSGCGADDCPITRLLKVPVDYVLLEPETTALVNDRNKEGVLPSLIQYLHSMHIEVFAEGVADDAQISSLYRQECIGVIPASNYQGKIPYECRDLSEEDAIALAQEKQE